MASMYHSTRSTEAQCTAKRAVLDGIAPDGGLYVTDELGSQALPAEAFVPLTYAQTAEMVLSALLDDYAPEEIAACVEAAYGTTFDADEVAPLAHVGTDYVLELFHGPTSAFKDVALQMLPQLMGHAAAQTQERIMILAATSGDTGKAALAGFAGTENLGITVFYPHGGTSEIQRLQMVTQPGDNVAVCAVEGNFDDTQSTVKRIFADEQLRSELAEDGIVLSSANSINIGRLAPQVVYYFTAYAQLCRSGAVSAGQKVDFCVPTGNFGDVLAGYFAFRMGLPVNRFIVASNRNNILTDFLTTGVYDRNRPFYRTASPSMDILISSNLERLLYYVAKDAHEAGEDLDGAADACAYVSGLMAELASEGRYRVCDCVLERIQALFACGWADDDQAKEAIRTCFADNGYLMDTHTAVAWHVLKSLPPQSAAARVVLSTASPYKFAGEVLSALHPGETAPQDAADDFACMKRLQAETGTVAPRALAELEGASERFGDVIGAEAMPAYVRSACKEILA